MGKLFHGGEPAAPVAAPSSAYVPPKQPKKGIYYKDNITWFSSFVKDSPPKVMIASVVQAFQL